MSAAVRRRESFHDRLSRIQDGYAEGRLPKRAPPVEAIHEFADFINKNRAGVESWVREGFAPEAVYLCVAPRHRREEAEVVETFWRDGARLRPALDDTRKALSAKEMESHLARQLETDQFQEILNRLEGRSKEDGQGLLRTYAPRIPSISDAPVRVPAEEHAKIAIAASEGSKARVTVEWFDDTRKIWSNYRHLVSGSFALTDIQISSVPDGHLLEVEGTATAL